MSPLLPSSSSSSSLRSAISLSSATFIFPPKFPNRLELEVLLDQLSPEPRRRNVIFSTFFSSGLDGFISSLGDFFFTFLDDVNSLPLELLGTPSFNPVSNEVCRFFFLSVAGLLEDSDFIFSLISFISSNLSLLSLLAPGSSKGMKPTPFPGFAMASSCFFFFFLTSCTCVSSVPDVLADLLSPGVAASCVLRVLLAIAPSCLNFLFLSRSCASDET